MTETVELLIENCSPLLFHGRRGEEEGVLPEGSVALADGKIVAVGPKRELAGRFRARERIDGAGRLLTPGFVDSHTHLVFAGDRADEFVARCRGAGYEEIAARGGGIRASVRATRAATEEELFALALPRVARMAALGSTTIEIKSGYGLDVESELRILRVIRRLGEESPARIVPTFCGAHEIPDEFRGDRTGYLDLVCEEMIPRVAEAGLARFCDVFCEHGVFTPEESERVLEAGKRAGLGAKVHADELHASGGSEVAARVGAVSADHLMMITDDGIAGLAAKGVVATLLPGTTFTLRKERWAPARRLLDAGVDVALATDRNAGSCAIESMQFVLGLACLALAMTPAEAFRGATLQGARALGLAEECGRIESGCRADLILWDAHRLAGPIWEFANITPRAVFAGGKRVPPRPLGGAAPA